MGPRRVAALSSDTSTVVGAGPTVSSSSTSVGATKLGSKGRRVSVPPIKDPYIGCLSTPFRLLPVT
jgi:hypothetical protein